MLYHHGPGDYKTAASAAAKKARADMEGMIEKGKASAEAVYNQVNTQIPHDMIVKTKALTVHPSPSGESYFLQTPQQNFGLHENAFNQIQAATFLPDKFTDKMRQAGEWGPKLVAHAMSEIFHHNEDGRNLIRAVKGRGDKEEVRGFLSDSFKRIDSRPMIDSFINACKDIGAVPIDGYALEERVRLRVVLPYVFEPVENEVMIFGLQWGNSDFGKGGHESSAWWKRLFCTNNAVAETVFRQVHHGKRLEDNFQYSEKTYKLDQKAHASALADVVKRFLSAEAINSYMNTIKKANETKIGEADISRLLKTKLSESEFDSVEGLFEGNDMYNLPPVQSLYRLSNAVSFFAQSKDISRKRRLELEEIAGGMMPKSGLKEMAV